MVGIDLTVLFVQHDTRKYPEAFEKLKLLVDRIKFCKKTYFIIDNRNEGDYTEKIGGGVFKVGGDDTSREFSGWQRGLEKLREEGGNYEVVLFLTEAVLAPGRSFLGDYGTKSLLMSYLLTSAVGRPDSFGSRGFLLDKEVSEWLCTGCFFLPRRIIESLGSIVTVDDNTMDLFLDREFRGEIFKREAPINDSYKEFIVKWLTERRHRTFAINRDTWGEFREKVRAMFNEALLSVRIKEKGYKVRSYGAKKYY